MARITLGLVIGTASLSLCTTTHAAPVERLTDDDLRQCIVHEAEKLDLVGVISIARPGGTINFARGPIGGPGSPAILPDTQFNLGSAGKMFTAVAVAQLVDVKKIGLDDPIGRYVPDLTPEASAVTIGQLLTHSGGLGNFFTPDNLSLLEKARSLADLKPLVVGDTPSFAPGSGFAYSNSGFLLLGLMVEAVSGLSYADYLSTHIFGPAGMANATVLPKSPSGRAIGMTRMPALPPVEPGQIPKQGSASPLPPPPAMIGLPMMQGPPPPPPNAPLRPAVEAALVGNAAGGSYASPQDMHRFFAALRAARLTSVTMRDRLLSPQFTIAPASDSKAARSHGLGFALGVYGGHKWFGHNGGTLGVNVEFMAFSDDQIDVAIMTNRDPPIATALGRKLLAVIFDGEDCHGRRSTTDVNQSAQ